jgi:TolC family type I secretion outer membrane protein
MRPALAALIALLLPSLAQADPPVRSLSAVALLAIQQDPRLETAASRVDLSRAGREQALAGYRPNLSFVTSAGRARYDLNGGTHPDRDPTAAGLNLSQPIYDFGRTSSEVAAATALMESADASTRATVIDVVQDAVTAALHVDFAHHVLATVSENARVLSERLAYTRGKFEAGDFTRTDVAQAEARYASAESQVQAAEAALSTAQANLQRITGQQLDVDLKHIPTLPAPASLSAALDSLQRHPELEAANHAVQGAEHSEMATRAQRRPRVDLIGAVGRDDETRFTMTTTDYWSASLQLSVPLYERGLARAREDRAHAELRRERAAQQSVQRQLEQRVATGWANLSASRAERTAAQEESRAADVALEGMQAELDSGLRTVIDLLNAQQDALDARLAELDARYRETISTVQLLAATGELQLKMLGSQ